MLRQNYNKNSFHCSPGKFAKFDVILLGFVGHRLLKGFYYVLLGSHCLIIITYSIVRSDIYYVMPTIARQLIVTRPQVEYSAHLTLSHVLEHVPPISCSVSFAQLQLSIIKPQKCELLLIFSRISSTSEELRRIRLSLILCDVGSSRLFCRILFIR